MPQPGEPLEAGKRPEPREKFPHLPYSSPREPLSPRPLDAYEGAAVLRARSRSPGINPWLFVMATALNTTVASVLAVIITLGVVNQERPAGDARDTQDSAPPRPLVGGRDLTFATTSTFQPISLRPIGSPERPLQLEPQRPAPLPLHILPEGGAEEPFILALSGAPAGTILFGANRIGSDSWFLPPGAASRLEIVLPEWSTSLFEIGISLRRTNGQVAAQTKAWIAVPPPGSWPAATPKADEAVTKDLMTKADRLIAKGDIIGARVIYQRAAEMGSGAAALALGATYDPNRLWSLGALGIAGNKERARQWYQRASDLGNSEAKARLTALGF
jgi:hypothetical protein